MEKPKRRTEELGCGICWVSKGTQHKGCQMNQMSIYWFYWIYWVFIESTTQSLSIKFFRCLWGNQAQNGGSWVQFEINRHLNENKHQNIFFFFKEKQEVPVEEKLHRILCCGRGMSLILQSHCKFYRIVLKKDFINILKTTIKL